MFLRIEGGVSLLLIVYACECEWEVYLEDLLVLHVDMVLIA